MDHETFVERLRDGDEEAYRLLFDLYYSWLCHASFGITHDTMAASSIVNDVFVRLWQSRNRLVITTSLQAYLYQAVRNASYNYLHTPSMRREIPSSALVQAMEPHLAEAPADPVEMDELRQRVDQALTQVPTASRRVFLMSRQQGLTREQIARQLGISTSTVRYHLKVAMQILRQALHDYLS